MSEQPEWYRAWRHEEREAERRLSASPRLRRVETIRRVVGNALLVGAMVFMFLSIREVVGW